MHCRGHWKTTMFVALLFLDSSARFLGKSTGSKNGNGSSPERTRLRFAVLVVSDQFSGTQDAAEDDEFVYFSDEISTLGAVVVS